MKFINYLETITGISIYPLMSLIIFICVFTFFTIMVMRTDNAFIDHMKNIPLENDTEK